MEHSGEKSFQTSESSGYSLKPLILFVIKNRLLIVFVILQKQYMLLREKQIQIRKEKEKNPQSYTNRLPSLTLRVMPYLWLLYLSRPKGEPESSTRKGPFSHCGRRAGEIHSKDLRPWRMDVKDWAFRLCFVSFPSAIWHPNAKVSCTR